MMNKSRKLLILVAVFICVMGMSACAEENPSHDRSGRIYSYAPIDTFTASDLRISGVTLSSSRAYTSATGTITNHGSRIVRFVEVKAAFKDSAGKTIDTDWTYAVGSEGLSPGESTKFTLMVDKDSSIKDCAVVVQDFD